MQSPIGSLGFLSISETVFIWKKNQTNKTNVGLLSSTLCITLSFCQQREVKKCLFPTCLKIIVNVEKFREVVVADCQVTVTGDTNIFKISIKNSERFEHW